MALATLCSKLRQSPEGSGLSFTAFIIDHGLRPGSDDEALKVAQLLKNIGAFFKLCAGMFYNSHQTDVPSKIITLDPHQYGDAHRTQKIESAARRLRYRALGQECRTQGITNLLFAHHADDQAETALMRLANNYLGTGLAGMRREARIPECEDMYGVHNSGAPRAVLQLHASSITKPRHVKMLVEGGGVVILRPLLNYTKDMLIATCEESSVPWVEDQTNQDRSLTLRNTIRYLHEADLLPVALRRPNLSAIAARVSENATRLEARVDKIFRSFDITFHPRSGHAVCKITHRTIDKINAMPDCDHVRVILLRKLLLLVAPTDNLDLSTLEAPSAHFLRPNNQSTATIAVGNALAVRVKVEGDSAVYELSRAPPSRRAQRVHLDVKISLPLQPREEDISQASWSNWQLWDKRYWIRFGGHGHDQAKTLNVVVRLLTLEDIAALRSDLHHNVSFDETLASVKGTLHTALPVIVEMLPDKPSRIVALPSLRWGRDKWYCRGQTTHNHDQDAQYYDIRYKQIEDSLTVPSRRKQRI
jgi:tRNA(Ile)-lysidine synthase